MKLPHYVDRQFWLSFLLAVAFYGTLVPALVAASWWLEEWAAIGFFAFLLWAYRWPIGVKLGLCTRRPGVLTTVAASPPAPARAPDARGA